MAKPAKTQTKHIEVFKPGTFTAMSGVSFSATAEDLKALAGRYDAAKHPVPVVIGHPTTDTPAYGWVKEFAYDDETERLIAEIGELEPSFSEAVSEGRYKRISMSFYKEGSTANPAGDALYPKHVGFLGAAPPAVPGLKPVEFSGADSETLTIEFGDPALKDVASLFRSMRDFFIDKFGLEDADATLPNWTINWIDEAGTQSSPELDNFSNPEEDPAMPNTPGRGTAALDARTADLDAREQKLRAREQEQISADHDAFTEGLINEGRLATGNKGRVVALLNSIAASEPQEVSFAESGETKTEDLLAATKSLLSSQSKIVEFGEQDLGEAPGELANDPEAIALEAMNFRSEQAAKGVEISTSAAVLEVRKKRGLSD
ncbi:hypothetical protein [Flexibacterium corallicola]|uniref:hypothetical protein n=1 Tax=Flexibacterium corallicola TaxID=3037259 RepID=UPI00286FA3D2|nr:hypothetical protein [Pseudovibrio sp. M1P-2-3]